ncbi:germination protein YpeB [Virgibacillus phasianinus]|uniref:Germination protein YpeB n=1 Tax=Virgibacillus phasianinus TaxID=2017483 RepID=A0A220U5Z9_9BACI|nr:germination protein YpeB [Virgibacillus phasianinus]ASK63326.1 germination protein YpeB [Virgibacillus phasianinus]
MVRWILITVLTLGIVGVGVWGYQEHQEKNSVLIQAENNYQRAFHELTYHMDLLHNKIGTSLAMNSPNSLSPQLVEIWRLSSQALSDVGQLPLALMPFNKTEEFLANIGDFTYDTAVRDLETKPLSKEETTRLEKLYEQSGDVKKQLRKVQHMVLKNNLRWMDVQLALANSDEQTDNTIIDGFKTVEKKIGGFTESNVDSTLIGTSSKEHPYQFLKGSNIGKNEALKKSRKLFNVDKDANLTITKTGKGADIPMYSISYRGSDKNAYMDMTQKGGHPISLLVNRPVNQNKISLNQGLDKAKAYIKEQGFDNMVIFQSDEYSNIGVYSFLYDENGVRVYSDAIEVKVALDNGDILGFTARNYFMNHKKRDLPSPGISEKEARDQVNPDVDIQEKHLAVIDNSEGKEVLAYEFLGVLNNETFRIFINAMDGTEEKVEKLDGTEVNLDLVL